MTTPAPVIIEPAQQAKLCDVCGHPDDLHDPVARRYCSATMENALSRHCICS